MSGIYQVYNNGYTVYQVYIEYIIIGFVKWRGGSIPLLLIDREGGVDRCGGLINPVLCSSCIQVDG